jgi:hypothetical protein
MVHLDSLNVGGTSDKVIVVMVMPFKLSFIGNMNKMDKIGVAHFGKVMDTKYYVI